MTTTWCQGWLDLLDPVWSKLCSSPERLPASSAAGISPLLYWEIVEYLVGRNQETAHSTTQHTKLNLPVRELTRSSTARPPGEAPAWWDPVDASLCPWTAVSPQLSTRTHTASVRGQVVFHAFVQWAGTYVLIFFERKYLFINLWRIKTLKNMSWL